MWKTLYHDRIRKRRRKREKLSKYRVRSGPLINISLIKSLNFKFFSINLTEMFIISNSTLMNIPCLSHPNWFLLCVTTPLLILSHHLHDLYSWDHYNVDHWRKKELLWHRSETVIYSNKAWSSQAVPLLCFQIIISKWAHNPHSFPSSFILTTIIIN